MGNREWSRKEKPDTDLVVQSLLKKTGELFRSVNPLRCFHGPDTGRRCV